MSSENLKKSDLNLLESISAKLESQNYELLQLFSAYNGLYDRIFIPNDEKGCGEGGSCIDTPILSLKDRILDKLEYNQKLITMLEDQFVKLNQEL